MYTNFAKTLTLISLTTCLAACGGGSGAGSEKDQTLVDDRFVFANNEQRSVPASQGVLANDGDDFTDARIVTSVDPSSSLTLQTDGSFTYKAGPGLESDSFTYSATLPNGDFKIASAKIVLLPSQTTSLCSEYNVASSRDFNLSLLPDSVTENDGLTLSIVEPPTKGDLSLLNDSIRATYNHYGNTRGKDTVEIRVDDAYGGSNTLTYTIALYPVRIMPLGDSLTQGITSDSTDEPGDPALDSPPMNIRVGYRKPLHDLLNQSGYNFSFVGSQNNAGFASFSEYLHEGHPGFSDYEIAGFTDPDGSNAGDVFNPSIHGVYNWLQRNRADVILLHAGTNNVRFRTSSVGVEAILDEIARWDSANSAQTTTFVAKIVDKNRSADDHQNVLQFNADLEQLLNARIENGDRVKSVPMFSAVPYSVAPAANPTFDALDRTHLTDFGYQRMALGWKESIDQDPTVFGRCP